MRTEPVDKIMELIEDYAKNKGHLMRLTTCLDAPSGDEHIQRTEYADSLRFRIRLKLTEMQLDAEAVRE